MTFINLLVFSFYLYLALGLLMVVAASLKGLSKIDPVTKEATWGFRLMIIPGMIGLWPLLIMRWYKANNK